MAPGKLTDDTLEVSSFTQTNGADTRPVVYMLDNFHPEAIKYCQKRFRTILPGDTEFSNWRQNAQYLLVRSSTVTAEDIARCPNLRAIGKQGVGVDKIDAAACEARGIRIFNTPGVNAGAVAEIVLALTMAVARDVPRIQLNQAQGKLVPKETCTGLIIYGKTLGLLGMGNIGERVARIFRGAFDAKVVAYDPYAPETAWADIPHTRVSSVEEVLRAADILSIHVPLTSTTRNMISYEQLSMMKREAILINAARGGIVNEEDLVRGLQDKLIYAAGLDCHEQEPPSKERYGALWEQRVVSTPHIGAATDQTQRETATAAVQKLYEFVHSSQP